jgi:hypothetical protein
MTPAADQNGPEEPHGSGGSDRPHGSAGDQPTTGNRTPTETAVLDALVEREGEGMTVFELRTWVDADIDELEATLEELDRDGCIDVDASGDRTRILPTDAAVAAREEADDRALLERVREWLLL